jgi:hypothetical protein
LGEIVKIGNLFYLASLGIGNSGEWVIKIRQRKMVYTLAVGETHNGG